MLAPLAEARPFGGRAYADAGIFAFERRAIFERAWSCVGREEELDLPGRWIRTDVAGEPVRVVRGADLGLRAFLDVCRHRGAPLGTAPCGRDARLVCPYHGWTYGLDGRLLDAPFAPAGFDRDVHGLVPVRVDASRGFVFVTTDAEAPPLDAWLGAVPPWLDALPPLRRGRRTTYEVGANWKLLAENFQESHHFPGVHRALERLTPTAEARSWLEGERWLGGTMELRDAETVSTDGRRHGRPLLHGAPARVHDALLFPDLFTSLQPDYLLVYRLVPRAVDRTEVTADVHFHAAAFSPGFAPDDVYAFWDRVNDEDRAICEAQQRNVGSRAFDPACYATVEEGMHAFDRLVARIHLAALVEER